MPELTLEIRGEAMDWQRRFPFKLSLLLVATLMLPGCEDASSSKVSSTAELKVIAFSDDSVQLAIPASYSHSFEPDNTIAITPGEQSGVMVCLTLHSLPAPFANEFVKDQAESKGKQLRSVGDKAVFSESGSRDKGGREFEMTFWQIGFEDCVVVLSAEVDKLLSESEPVRDCLKSIPEMIASIKKTE